MPELNAGFVVQRMTVRELDAEIVAAYDAPFPDARYKAGPRVMPAIVGTGGQGNVEAWKVLDAWDKPFLTAYSDSDPLLSGGYRIFQRRVPGTVGQPHTTIAGAGRSYRQNKGTQGATETPFSPPCRAAGGRALLSHAPSRLSSAVPHT